MMKKIGNLFLIIGCLILLFVGYTKFKVYQEQQKLLKEFESLQFVTSEEDIAATDFNEGDMIGKLYIPKIDLTTPIVEGASQKNMETAVGHLTSSGSVSDLGKKDTNFAIAGHRTATFGKFFNRLDELELDDEIIIETPHKTYVFNVIDSKVIDPSEVEVIYPVKGKALTTLVTCHPIYSNKYRLIVTGELKEVKDNKKSKKA